MTEFDPAGPVLNLSEAILQKISWWFLGLCLVFTIIGGFVSPLDDQGKPILLLPDVKAVENYRRSVQHWIDEMGVLEGEIVVVLSTNTQGDLFSQSRVAQQTLQHAVELAQEVDRMNVPPIAIGVHEQILSTALSYLEAARDVMQWVSAPQEENFDKTAAALEKARMMKNELEENSWLITP
jgi:hypothetical protein